MIFVFLLTSPSKMIRSIYVDANSIIAFFFMANISFCVCVHIYIYQIFFIHKCLTCFHGLTVVNGAAMNIGVHELEFSTFLDICPGVRLLGHIVAWLIVLKYLL